MSFSLAQRTQIVLRPDPSRVVLHLFVAGLEDYGSPHSRANLVLERALSLTEKEVRETLDEVMQLFHHRHKDLTYWFDLHAIRIASLISPSVSLTEERRRLIGALFTHEFSVEGAALTNPSMVVSGPTEKGSTPFVMSVRGIGDGHRSTIGFRTGAITDDGEVSIDQPSSNLKMGLQCETQLHKRSFLDLLQDKNDLGDNAKLILNNLTDNFTVSDLEIQINRLLNDRETFRTADITASHFRSITERSYAVSFSSDSELSDRILWPHASAEWRGMEDLRLVKFSEPTGGTFYFGTYTAFDGRSVSQQMLRTSDFASFEMFPATGKSATGKGLALFPRLIDGRFAALSRCDGETNSIAFSDTPDRWTLREELQSPRDCWELVQVGNCGSPLETEAGWLVLTHSVGPMRTYTIGAILLDLEDPARVIGRLPQPLIQPEDLSRDGYVPNVVYSCGGMIQGEHLVIPFGITDQSIGIATAHVQDLLDRMTPL